MSYKSNLNKVAKDIEKALEGLPFDSITAAVGQALLASNISRIHQKGKAADNTKIGEYSTKEILVGRQSFVKESAWNTLYKNNTNINKKLRRAEKALQKAADKYSDAFGYEAFDKAYNRITNIKSKNTGWKTIKRNGKLYHLIVLPGGYKALRQMQGRQSNFVNLNYSGKLQADFDLVAKGNKAELGFFTDYGATISDAMESKYKKEIWGVTKEDERDIVLIVEDIVADYIKRKL